MEDCYLIVHKTTTWSSEWCRTTRETLEGLVKARCW